MTEFNEGQLGGRPPEGIDQQGFVSPEALTPEQKRLRELSVGVAEILSNPEVTPEGGREVVIFELLFPRESNEKEPEQIEPWSVRPVIDALNKRAYSDRFSTHLQKIGGLPESYLRKYQRQPFGGESKEEDMVSEEGKKRKNEEEVEEWENVLHQTEAAIRLQNVFAQRSPLESDVDTYAERLFLSASYLKTLPPSMMKDLLETPGYGPATERALKLIIDIHLGVELKTPDGRKIETTFTKILQEKDSTEEDRRKFTEMLERQLEEEHVDSFIAKRAVILAKHLATATLLSVWLGGEEDKRGGKPEGICTFYNESQSDLIKLFYFRGKTLADLNKGRPAGPPVLAWIAPENLTTDFWHATKVGPKGKEKSIFDRWMGGENLKDVLKETPETAFSFWLYCMFRQNRVRKILWENKLPDMAVELITPEALRVISKDIQLGTGDLDDAEKELLKINLIGGRLLALGLHTIMNNPNEETLTAGALASVSRSVGSSVGGKAVRIYVEKACKIADFFLDGREWSLVERILREGRCLTWGSLSKSKKDVELLKEIAINQRITGKEELIKRISRTKSYGQAMEEIEKNKLEREKIRREIKQKLKARESRK